MIWRWHREEEKKLEIESPRIMITPESLADLRLYTMLCDVEISGFGKAMRLNDGNFIISDIITFPQHCGPMGTVLDDQAQADFLESLPADQNPGDYRLWWHSHVFANASWSETDFNTIERFDYADFWISIVLNKWREERVMLDFFQPKRKRIDRLPLFLNKPITEEEFRLLLKCRRFDIEKQIAQKIIISQDIEC